MTKDQSLIPLALLRHGAVSDLSFSKKTSGQQRALWTRLSGHE